jgi:hypothetical protein
MLPPRKFKISFGNTGIVIPIARTSSVTVTKMKVIAAWRDFTEKPAKTVEAAVSAAKFKSAAKPAAAAPPENVWRERLYI